MKALIKSITKILEDNKAERISIIDVTNKIVVTIAIISKLAGSPNRYSTSINVE